MKKLIFLIVMFVGMTAAATIQAPSAAASTEGTVTGIGTGSFPGRASFAGINLSSFEIATGVIAEPDGSAKGVFHAVLSGRTLLGAARIITLEGNVMQGTVTPDASSFSGLATLSLGDGLPAAPGVPFNVDTRNGTMALTIQSTTLPSAGFGQGGLDFGL